MADQLTASLTASIRSLSSCGTVIVVRKDLDFFATTPSLLFWPDWYVSSMHSMHLLVKGRSALFLAMRGGCRSPYHARLPPWARLWHMNPCRAMRVSGTF